MACTAQPGCAVRSPAEAGWPAISGQPQGGDGGESQFQPLVIDNTAPPEAKRAPEITCNIAGNRFRAQLTSKGAALKHVWMEGDKYTHTDEDKSEPINLVTTPVPVYLPLRTNLREPTGSAQQLAYNDFDWKLALMTAKSCRCRCSAACSALRCSSAATQLSHWTLLERYLIRAPVPRMVPGISIPH